jgi:hypothetical protein
MKRKKPKKMLKRKKNEGLISYFKRWADQDQSVISIETKEPKWGPIGVSWNLWRKINGIIDEL